MLAGVGAGGGGGRADFTYEGEGEVIAPLWGACLLFAGHRADSA